MTFLYIATLSLLFVSFAANRMKTGKALVVAFRRFLNIVPAFVVMLIFVAVFLYIIPEHLIARVLASEQKWAALAGALAVGSVSVMPGFIAFPLCSILLEQGALYMILSGFSTTLMMVGVVTFPLEKAYLGTKLAFFRNICSLGIAAAVAAATGFLFGEL